MKVVCVERDIFQLGDMKREVKRIVPYTRVTACRNPCKAAELDEAEGCDVLLTDANLSRAHTDGFMLAEKIKTLNPRVNIIFATERLENRYACAAYRLHASGYIKKPYNTAALAEEFQNLRFAVG